MKNPDLEDESRITFDYSRVVEELPRAHMPLIAGCHDYLSDSKHQCFMIADLKHAYFTVLVHSKNKKFFAFSIPEMRQLQLTQMQQGFKSAFFIMSELMVRALKKISRESSLLQNQIPDCSPLLSYYQDNIMKNYKSFEKQFVFLRDHFFFKIKWAKFRLFLKNCIYFSQPLGPWAYSIT